MPFVWAGILLLVLRLFGVEPVAGWSWFVVLAPFAVALAWFELIEPMFGLDRRDDPGQQFEDVRRKRIDAMFPTLRTGGRRPKSRPPASNEKPG